jgi:putative acetyltransferase
VQDARPDVGWVGKAARLSSFQHGVFWATMAPPVDSKRAASPVSERHIETTVLIDAPPDRVWETLTDFARMPDWNPFIRAISGPLQPGARLSVEIAPPGAPAMRFQPTVVGVTPGRELRWRGSLLVPGLFDGEHRFLLDPDGSGGTRLEHGESFSGVLAPLLLRGAALEATRDGFAAMNAALKQVVEARETPPTARPVENSSVRVEDEKPEHAAAVDALTRDAFGGDYEADLLARLRGEHLAIAAFVALDGEQVIGHVMLSELPTEVDGRPVKAACLAPLTVAALYRQQGIGARLLETAIATVRDQGYEAVFVLGDTRYYRRFGFSSQVSRKIACPFPGEAFMALELVPGALHGDKGAVKYPKAFQLEA